ncbi:MAG: sugar transferase [Acidimicrobiia bacterium]|nr:sugar transferase [Acidimicrobiia bacterium]
MGMSVAAPSWSRSDHAVDVDLRVLGPAPTLYQRRVKPVIDVTLSFMLLVALLPVMAIVALAIRARLGKGVLYRQRRVGLGGEEFMIYKFRTMAHDRRRQDLTFIGADRRRTHKDPNDPRHTTLGRFLRKTSLDELPQLFNVVKRDMSLVGPRPELPQIVAKYQPWQHQRHAVKPGITGPWQVSPYREHPMAEAINLDLGYVEAVSFTHDCGVLLKTIPAVLRRRSF